MSDVWINSSGSRTSSINQRVRNHVLIVDYWSLIVDVLIILVYIISHGPLASLVYPISEAGVTHQSSVRWLTVRVHIHSVRQSSSFRDHSSNQWGTLPAAIRQSSPTSSGQTKRQFALSYEDEYSGLKNVRILVYGRMFGLFPNIRPFYRIFGHFTEYMAN